MSISGINGVYRDYANTVANKKETSDMSVKAEDKVASEGIAAVENETTANDKGVIYESTTTKEDYKTKNAALIQQMKADSENRLAQMRSLVEKMFAKQGITIGKADDMWKILASGEFSADAETIAQAKADIAEDGYWGVKQTSERIFSFAKALSGGDAKKMEEMRTAFEKGFKEATKTWGRELPEITQKTYDAVQKMFDDYEEEKADVKAVE